MNTILEQYKEKINGTFSFFDRIIIKGHIRQFFSPSGKRHFLSYNNILLKDFPAHAQSVTDRLCKHIEKLASDFIPFSIKPLTIIPTHGILIRVMKNVV